MALRLLTEPIVRAALLEDLGRAGDITTDAVVAADREIDATIGARQAERWPGSTLRCWRSRSSTPRLPSR